MIRFFRNLLANRREQHIHLRNTTSMDAILGSISIAPPIKIGVMEITEISIASAQRRTKPRDALRFDIYQLASGELTVYSLEFGVDCIASTEAELQAAVKNKLSSNWKHYDIAPADQMTLYEFKILGNIHKKFSVRTFQLRQP
jgi:hypothetical protein